MCREHGGLSAAATETTALLGAPLNITLMLSIVQDDVLTEALQSGRLDAIVSLKLAERPERPLLPFFPVLQDQAVC
ncbi:hypothetical protein D3C76_181970 [compost metagenome]